jgi:hypothetical protein
MKKLIAFNFELDLSTYNITTTEQNPWFADAFNSKITFPFEIPLTDELDIALGFVSRNATFDTLYDVKYYEDNTIHDATFEIIGEQDGRLQVSYEYGLEQFPLWEKKLSDLQLQNFELIGQNMYEHAAANVNKVWPEKNYSFPAIHTPLYTDQDEMWAYFEGLINNYQFGEFLENTFDSEEVISYNANIVQPFPAFMHVMETIASDAGYVLAGDILTDTTLHDNFIYSSKEYFKKREPLEIPVIKLKSLPDVISTDPDYGTYESVVILNQNGKYLVSGFFRTNAKLGNGAFRNIKLGTTTMFTNYHDGGTLLSPNIFNKVAVEFEIEITNASASNELTFRAESVHVAYLGAPFTDFNVFDFTVTLIAEYDNITDEPIATVQQATAIDLRKSVPDMTVGEFITIFKNWFNYDYDIVGDEMIFNKIQDNMVFENLISLEQFEVKSKSRNFQQGMSFLLKFAAREESKFIFDEVYQDSKGYYTSGFIQNKNTNQIEINGLPLPLDTIRNFETASAFENSDSKLYIVRYAGLSSGRNATLSPEPLLIPQIHETNFRKWFDFRINAMTFKISFKALKNQVLNLNSKSKIFMYNKLHYVKTIMKTQTAPDIIEVEIESESVK